MNTDERHLRLLRIIRDLALLPYPYEEGDSADPHLILALGQIAGICDRAMAEHPRRAPVARPPDELQPP